MKGKRGVFIESRKIGETVNPSVAADKIARTFQAEGGSVTREQALKALKVTRNGFTVTIKELANVIRKERDGAAGLGQLQRDTAQMADLSASPPT